MRVHVDYGVLQVDKTVLCGPSAGLTIGRLVQDSFVHTLFAKISFRVSSTKRCFVE